MKKILFWFIFAVIWINVGHLVHYLHDKACWDYTKNGQIGISAKILYPSPTTFKIHRYIVSWLLDDKTVKKYADFQTYRRQGGFALESLTGLVSPFWMIPSYLTVLIEWIIALIHIVIWKWLIVGLIWKVVLKFLFSGSWTNWL